MTVKEPRRIGPWSTLGSSFTIGQGIELSSPPWCSMRHQRLGTWRPRDSRCLVDLGGPGHQTTQFLPVNGCQGTMEPRSRKGQFRPGTNPADETGAASFEQELGGVGTLDPWTPGAWATEGPGPLGAWVPARAGLLGRRSILASRDQGEWVSEESRRLGDRCSMVAGHPGDRWAMAPRSRGTKGPISVVT
jgi:hypothetical protein